MGIRNQKVGNVLILVSFRNGLPRRPVGPPRNDRLFRQSRLPPSRGKVPPQGADEGGYRGCGGHRTGGWGHPPLRRVTIDFVGAAVLSGPSITGSPPWSPSSVMGLRPCHLLPCGAKAIAVPSGSLRYRWRSPHPSWLRHATFPQGKAFCFLPQERGNDGLF